MKILLLCLAVVAVQAKPLSPARIAQEFCHIKKTVAAEQRRSVTGNYFTDPQEQCAHYFMCFPDHNMAYWMPLAPGTYWNEFNNAISMITDQSICNMDPCQYPDIDQYGFYRPRGADCGVYMQCDRSTKTSIQMCCPAGQDFNVMTRLCEAVTEICPYACQLEEESDETAEEPTEEDLLKLIDVFEKGATYTCVQGDYTFTTSDPKWYTRTGADGTVIRESCSEEMPYFSYTRCTCYHPIAVDIPERDDMPTGLPGNMCYSVLDDQVYEKVGVNMFKMVKRPGGSSGKSVKKEKAGSRSSSRDGSSSGDVEVMTCPNDKVMFRLDICACGVYIEIIESPMTTEAPEIIENPERVIEDIYEKYKTYTCRRGDDTLTTSNPKTFTRTSPDGSVTKETCPEETPFFSYTRCTCYSLLTKLPEVEDPESKPIQDVYEKYETYTCQQGKDIITTSDPKHFTRTSTNGIVTKETCPEVTPYFSYTRCMCYSLVPIVPEPVNETDGRGPLVEPQEPEKAPEPIITPYYCNHYDMDSDKSRHYMKRTGSFMPHTPEACFSGQWNNYISLPVYQGNWFGNRLSLSLRYRFVKSMGGDKYVPILHNGIDRRTEMTDDRFSIAVKKDFVRVRLSTDVMTSCVAEVQLPPLRMTKIFPPRMPYVAVMVTYDGQKLSLWVEGRIFSTMCRGTIGTTANAINVGANFLGCVDDLYVCKDVFQPFRRN